MRTIRCRKCGHRDWHYRPNGTRECRFCSRRREHEKNKDPAYAERKRQARRRWWHSKPLAWRLEFSRRKWREQDPKRRAWLRARARARAKGIPFTITQAEVNERWGKRCPVFGTTWGPGGRRPSLDQIVAGAGYTADNTAVISWRANLLKNNATADELEQIAAWMRSAA